MSKFRRLDLMRRTWHKSDLPATVVGALVTDKTYPDPFFGTNLKTLPGMNYSNKSFFAIQDMPAGSPFLCSWWFRTEFTASALIAQKNVWLHFLGINYRANVWVNGVKIGDAKDVAGTYRAFEFDVSKNLRREEDKCRGAGDFCAAEGRFGNHLGGLESDSCGQGHGDLEGSFLDDQR